VNTNSYYFKVKRKHIESCTFVGAWKRIGKYLKLSSITPRELYKIKCKILEKPVTSEKAKASMKRWRELHRAPKYKDEASRRAGISQALKDRVPKTVLQNRAIKKIKAQRYNLQIINLQLNEIERRLAWDSLKASRLLETAEDKIERRRLRWQVASHRRDQRSSTIPGSFTTSQWFVLLKSHGYKCAYCQALRKDERAKGFDLEVEHIIPVTDPNCFNSEFNIIPACKRCNSSKSDKDLLEWGKFRESWDPRVLVKYQNMKEIAEI